MSLNPRVKGFVPVLLTSDSPDRMSSLKSHFVPGQAVNCTVLKKETGKGHQYNLSMIGEHPL